MKKIENKEIISKFPSSEELENIPVYSIKAVQEIRAQIWETAYNRGLEVGKCLGKLEGLEQAGKIFLK